MNDKPHPKTTAGPGLVPRLRGLWATITMDERADTWRLRLEAADEIERLRNALHHFAFTGTYTGRPSDAEAVKTARAILQDVRNEQHG